MSSSKNLEYQKTSFLSKSNSTFIEQMYLKFINKDSDLPESWKKYFLDIGEEVEIIAKEINGPSWNPKKKKIDIDAVKTNFEKEENKLQKDNTIRTINKNELSDENRRSIRAVSLIRSYRQRGHLIANLDPLELRKIEYLDELHPENYGFDKEDYDKKIYLDGIANKNYSTIKEILSFLRKTYCGKIGYEYMHISNPTERKWLRDRIEKDENALQFTKNGKEAILNKIIQSEGFEKFLHTKYVGTKRFGLDGAESLIPALEQVIKIGSQNKDKEVKIGMSHRGRLNVWQMFYKNHIKEYLMSSLEK